MELGRVTVQEVERDGKWLYRVGGISALVLASAYIVIFPLFARVGAPPSGGGDAWLQYLEGKTTVWWAILGLSVLTDFLFVPVALSLYVALQRVNKNAMLLATSFTGMFVVLDLAVTWTNYASLLTLSGLYTATNNEAQRMAYVAAADYASAVLASRAEIFYSIVDLSLGIFIIGLVMLQGTRIFNKTTAYLGLAAGILGMISAGRFFITIMMNAILTTVWLLFVGYRLFKLGQKIPVERLATP